MRIISCIEDRQVIQAILKHLELWLVKSKPTPKAHAPPALNQHGSGPPGYILDHFSQLPMNDNSFYPAKRGTTPGMLTFSPKKRWRIGGGRNRYARMSLKNTRGASPNHWNPALATSIPKIPPIPAEPVPKQTQDLVLRFS